MNQDNSALGERARQRVSSLLNERQGGLEPDFLRDLALRCARLSAPKLQGQLGALSRMEEGRDRPAVAARVREDLSDAACAAVVVGMRVDSLGASRLLSVFACSHPNAREALEGAVFYAVRAAPDEPAGLAVLSRVLTWLE